MDATGLLMAFLSMDIPAKYDERIRDKVTRKECLCCTKPMYRGGFCGEHYEERRAVMASMTKAKKVEYIEKMRKVGLYLFPYEMRKFKKPMSIIRKLAQ